jgi:hypothetical protein
LVVPTVIWYALCSPEQAGDEEAWLSEDSASCVELKADGNPEVIMADYNPASVGRAGPRQTRGKRTDQARELPARQAR